MQEKEKQVESIEIATQEVARILSKQNAVKLITNELKQYLGHLEGKP